MNESTVITPVVTELLTLSEAKSYLKIDHADEDTLITMFIKAAREHIERICSVSIGEQERLWQVDIKGKTGHVSMPTVAEAIRNQDWCSSTGGGMEIPYGPVVSVNTVTTGSNGAYTAYTDYILDDDEFTAGEGRYKVAYTAGYSDTTLPAGLKLLWLQLLAFIYTNRGEESAEVPPFIRKALIPYKRFLV